MSDGDTRPGFRHRSSRPPSEELPEPVVDVSATPIKTLYQYVAELHHDIRSMRAEFGGRLEGSRSAIYSLQNSMAAVETAVDRLTLSQSRAFKMLAIDRLIVCFLLFAILAVMLLRAYRLIGV